MHADLAQHRAAPAVLRGIRMGSDSDFVVVEVVELPFEPAIGQHVFELTPCSFATLGGRFDLLVDAIHETIEVPITATVAFARELIVQVETFLVSVHGCRFPKKNLQKSETSPPLEGRRASELYTIDRLSQLLSCAAAMALRRAANRFAETRPRGAKPL
jgi:hypothetical protein